MVMVSHQSQTTQMMVGMVEKGQTQLKVGIWEDVYHVLMEDEDDSALTAGGHWHV
jgi:hypothetical protein